MQDWKDAGCIYGNDVATLACIPVVMQNIINFLAIFAGVLCILFIIFASFKYITSEGDPEKVATARKTLFYAIGGLFVVSIAFVALNLISAFTGVTSIAPKP